MSSFAFNFAMQDAHADDSVHIPMPAAAAPPPTATAALAHWQAAVEVWPLLPGERMQVFSSEPLHDEAQVVAATEALYQRILQAVPISRIYRIWNFLPDINQGGGPLDHYMLFCQGRADAYTEQGHSDDLFAAASALGYRTRAGQLQGERIVAVVMSGPEAVVPVENPNQVPAYRYPQTYGPRSPSFARAVTIGDSRVLVSGTASILKSESQHLGDPVRQAELAAANVRTLLGLVNLPARTHPHQHLRVYLRDLKDWSRVAPVLAHAFSFEQVQLVVAEADICRPELLVEVEYASHR